VRAVHVRALPGGLRPAGRRMRRTHTRLQPMSDGADLRRLRSLGPVLHAAFEHVYAATVSVERHVRPGNRRLRRRHRELRNLHTASNMRRRWGLRPVRRQLGLRSLDLRAAEHRVRAGGGRVWQPHSERLRRVSDEPDVRRRRGLRSVRRRRHLHAADVRAAQHQLRSGRGWLRQPHPQLWNLRAPRYLRRQRHVGRMRRPGRSLA